VPADDESSADYAVVQPKDEASKGYLTTDFLSKLVPSFTQAQRDVVVAAGFGFVLCTPFFKPPLRVSAWNMLLYDEERSEMRLDSHRVVPLAGTEVGLVMGLPQGRPFPENVWESGTILDDIDNLSIIFPQNGTPRTQSATSCISVEAARRFLYNMKGNTMDEHQANIFKKAVVLVAVNDLLAPSRSHKDVDIKVVHAIQDPDGPAAYNWAEFTLQGIKDASRNLKAQLMVNDKAVSKTIGGCTIFLLVRKLDCFVLYFIHRLQILSMASMLITNNSYVSILR
jgi:hypothetical protein